MYLLWSYWLCELKFFNENRTVAVLKNNNNKKNSSKQIYYACGKEKNDFAYQFMSSQGFWLNMLTGGDFFLFFMYNKQHQCDCVTLYTIFPSGKHSPFQLRNSGAVIDTCFSFSVAVEFLMKISFEMWGKRQFTVDQAHWDWCRSMEQIHFRRKMRQTTTRYYTDTGRWNISFITLVSINTQCW